MSRPILTREQMRAYDTCAIEECGVPGVVLMENAGRGAADVIAEHSGPGPVLVVCGTGNNGGDGFVVARQLLARGIYTEVVLLGAEKSVKGDARLNLSALVGVGSEVLLVDDDDMDALTQALETAVVCVDAIFGTGLTRPIEGRVLAAIEAMNVADCPCIALDIPSGIDANTGAVLGGAVRAQLTVTFGQHKAGLFQGPGVVHSGQVVLVGLGIPDVNIVEQVGFAAELIDPERVRDALGKRSPDLHKYRAGSVLVLAGSEGKLGAAMLAARGVLRAGGGIATIGSWPEAVRLLDGHVTEVMTAPIDPADLEATLSAALDRRTAIAIGPGLGTDDRAKALVERVVLRWDGPVVVDADAISCFAGRAAALKKAKGPRILTPHTGELARLLGMKSDEVEAHRFEAARQAAAKTGCTVVLKGPHTIVASEGGLEVCAEGGPLLATAGSGDVLTGVVAAMLCHLPAHEAACAAVLLHARAADRWAARTGADRGMLAGDIADALPDALASLHQEEEEAS